MRHACVHNYGVRYRSTLPAATSSTSCSSCCSSQLLCYTRQTRPGGGCNLTTPIALDRFAGLGRLELFHSSSRTAQCVYVCVLMTDKSRRMEKYAPEPPFLVCPRTSGPNRPIVCCCETRLPTASACCFTSCIFSYTTSFGTLWSLRTISSS